MNNRKDRIEYAKRRLIYTPEEDVTVCISIVENILDSIGSCSECEHDGECDTQSMLDIKKGSSWYCADFERKDNVEE